MKKKILIVSDSHGNSTRLSLILRKEYPFDYLVHCGDGVTDLFNVDILPGISVIKVTGNVDLHRGLDINRIEVFQVEGKTFMVIHGERSCVKSGFDKLLMESNEWGADVVLFGHTHVESISGNEPVLFNPGPANDGSYGIIFVSSEHLEFCHKRLK